MANAICIRCGVAKERWARTCPECGFDPHSDFRSGAKSYILSTERIDLGDGVPAEEELPEFDGEALDAIGERIRSGLPVGFDPGHVRRIADILRAAEEGPVSVWKMAWRLLLFLWPAIALFFVGVCAIWFFRRLR